MSVHQFPPPAPRGPAAPGLAGVEALPAGRRRLNQIRAWEANACAGLVRLDADDDLVAAVRSIAEALRERLLRVD